MIRLILTMYGVPVIRTLPLTRADADARIARWSALYYRVAAVTEEAE